MADSSTTREGSTSRTATRKSPAKSTSRSTSKSSNGGTKKAGSSSVRRTAPRTEAEPKAGAGKIARQGMDQLLELTGKEPEGLVGLEKEGVSRRPPGAVAEGPRIPYTTDVLALYEVEVDGKGQLQGYKRVRRYARGAPDGS
jgi:hypothetical protein